MAKYLLLINPVQDATLRLGSELQFRLPPLSLSYLAALTPSDWSIKVVDENVEPLRFEDADLVAITAMTNNAPRAYEISERYRRNGAKTVMGGVHASMLCDEAAQFVDSVAIGEGETIWQNLINDFKANALKRQYRGERVSMENLVRPRRDVYNSANYLIEAVVETARGCPMDCDFCSVTTLYGRRYRQRPVEDVLDELEAVNTKNVYFPDDNIIGYGTKAEARAIQLFRGMVERGLNKRWSCQAGIDFANNQEVLKYAYKAGCLTVFIGFESLNDDSLQSMNKARNLKVGARNYKDVIDRIHDHGIAVVGAFAFGSDGDKKDVFDRTIEFLLNSKIDAAQLSILTPLPGTRLYNRLRKERRLLRTNYPDDWKHYGFTEAVFRPKNMTPEELEEGVNRVYECTTSRVTSLRRAVRSFIQGKSLYAGIGCYLWNRGYRSVWMRNYEYIKNRSRSLAEDDHLSPNVGYVDDSAGQFAEGRTIR